MLRRGSVLTGREKTLHLGSALLGNSNRIDSKSYVRSENRRRDFYCRTIIDRLH